MRLAVALAALVGAAGCGRGVYFSDDEGGPRGGGDELSLPYAVGTTVTIAVLGGSATQVAGWRVTSDDPNKLSIDKITPNASANPPELDARVIAIAAGDTQIHLVDASGATLRSASVSIRAPDAAKLFAHGPLRIAGEDSSKFAAAEVDEARVLVGGEGVFGVTYYQGGTRVYGRGIAGVQPLAGVTVEDHTSQRAPTNEWLFIKPTQAGTQMLALAPGGATVASLPLVAVNESDVARLALVEEAITGTRGDKQKVWVLPVASDTAGRQVHGYYTNWTLDGAPQTDGKMPAMGDLYRYEFQPGGAPRTLVASRGSLTTMATITAYDGTVYDTTYLGCAVAPGRRARPPLAALALLGLAVLLRKRRLFFGR